MFTCTFVLNRRFQFQKRSQLFIGVHMCDADDWRLRHFFNNDARWESVTIQPL